MVLKYLPFHKFNCPHYRSNLVQFFLQNQLWSSYFDVACDNLSQAVRSGALAQECNPEVLVQYPKNGSWGGHVIPAEICQN